MEKTVHYEKTLTSETLFEGRDLWLYAGGGLLADSNEEDEWNETEAKMETMRRLFES